MNSIKVFVCHYCRESRLQNQMVPNPEYSTEAHSFKCEWCVRDKINEPMEIEKPKNYFFEKILKKNRKRI